MRSLALLTAVFLAGPAFAADVAEDCSWSDGEVSVAPAQDLGNGKVMVLAELGGPGMTEIMVGLADCTMAEVAAALAADGKMPDASQPPFSLGPDRLAADLFADLQAAGLEAKFGTLAQVLQADPYRQSPFCGCAIFYPDSPGASDVPVEGGTN